MASRQLRPNGKNDSEPFTTSGPEPPTGVNEPPTTNAVLDIGNFVDSYSRFLELLYPVGIIANACLYVIRWENSPLTITTLFVLCVLFYFPALLVGSLVALAIVVMAIGKYYRQTKLSSVLKHREIHQVEYLDEDTQILRRCRKDQKVAHKLLLEYRQINCNIERIIIMASDVLDYMYRIVLWKSPEVSLCVTVLWCVLFMLVCTVYLRFLSASLPLIIICFNKHFIKRTVELWKTTINCVFRNFKLKRETTSLHQDHLLTEPDDTGAIGSSDSDTTQVLSTSDQSHGATLVGLGLNGTILSSTDRDWVGGGSRDSAAVSSKGLCNKCNTSLAKILKRKHDCNYCGQSYCGSCTVKVKRAVLGATSPAAFEESVRVCLDCKHKLDDLKLSKTPIISPS